MLSDDDVKARLDELRRYIITLQHFCIVVLIGMIVVVIVVDAIARNSVCEVR